MQHFYLLIEIFISLIGAGLLLAIWKAIQKRFKHKLANEITIKRVDRGLLFLSLSLFVWSLSALFTYINISYFKNEWLILVSQHIFSIFNSLFLILALFYLDNSPQYLYNNKKSTRIIILFLVGLSILSFVLSLTVGKRIGAFPDLLLSTILSWFLAISLYKTFSNRNMKTVAIIAVFSIVILLLSQLSIFAVEHFKFYIYLLRIISKVALIGIFLVMGTSWVLELSEIPNVTNMKINFTDWNQIQISIPSKGIIDNTIAFGKKTTQFNNLLKFAIRRKFAPENEMCVEVYNGGEIVSQTYLSRIIENINEILALDNDNKLNRNDVFTFIGQGKYRLRFLPDFITIDTALLNEFVHNTENELYKDFV